MKNRERIHQYTVDPIGTISFVDYDNEQDAKTIHPWVNMEYAKFWMLNNSTLEDVKLEYRKIMAPTGTHVYLGYLDERPMFLTEIYDPAAEEIAKHIGVKAGDFGMHILVAPAEKHIPNFTQTVFRTIMRFLFDYHKAKRVIVEPDVDNHKIHIMNEKAGFQVIKDAVVLSSKTARLEVCTRENFLNSELMRRRNKA